jgi:hypothetical protein
LTTPVDREQGEWVAPVVLAQAAPAAQVASVCLEPLVSSELLAGSEPPAELVTQGGSEMPAGPAIPAELVKPAELGNCATLRAQVLPEQQFERRHSSRRRQSQPSLSARALPACFYFSYFLFRYFHSSIATVTAKLFPLIRRATI